MSNYFEFSGFCPEVDIGLSIPREPIRLVTIDDKVHCVGTKTKTIDVTEDLYHSADEQKAWHQHLCGYILKKGSPSCGMERVRLYKGDMPDRTGVGLYAERLMQNFPNLPVEEEGRLEDAVLRENFIQRVFVYSRWQKLIAQQPSMKSLTLFHAQHKYIYVSHDQLLARQLGSWLADNHKTDMATLAPQYLSKMMALLKKNATRKNHVNTLQHIQGYLKKHLGRIDYGSHRKGGYPIGSGGIESAHRFICHVRLKRSGAWWYVENSNRMLALRCADYNGTFQRVFQKYVRRDQVSRIT